MKKHYETHVEDTDKLISVAGPVLDYKSWYEQYRKLMEEQAQRKYGLYTPTSEGDDDDFPSITGMIARYSALGLTNEQMAANPVWVDKTGNGHDLQMKNFAWKEGSGISDVYPGFILGDGVDDFAVTEKELNFEDTYTVYTAFVPFQSDPVRAMEMCGKDFKKDFYLYYSGIHLVYYTSGLNGFIPVHINQFHIIVCKRDKTNAVIKNLITGESKTFSVSELIDNPGVYYLWRYRIAGTPTSRAAIAGQTICNGYFSTDEDDEKVLDWYKKQYPWLFPDQAWTVVGKTNEDEDRATIANITGNGNDLVLSNFGFAEGSGYGLYKLNFNNWFANSGSGNVNIVNVVNPHKIVLEQSQEAVGAFFLGKNVSYTGELKISVSNKPSDIELSFGSSALGKVVLNEGINIVKINPVNTSIGFFTNKAFEAQNIIIEQIPEYEGYLVTDGVDDRVVSSSFTLNKDWTIVGNWKMLQPEDNKSAGIVKQNSLFIYNHVDGLSISINAAYSFFKLKDIRSVNAICSDGRIYLNDWTEIIDSKQQTVNESVGTLVIGILGNVYTSLAFKNLGFYNNQNLSKDDCIKAYNYLQTLKAK